MERCGVWLLTAQKPINRTGWWKGKFALFQTAATRQEGGCLSRGQLPSTDSQWGGSFIDRRRGLHSEAAESTLLVIVKLVIRGLTCVILVDGVQLIFSSRSVCFHFSEAISQNCCSFCRGCSLAIMQLTSPPGVSVSIRQLTGYGSEYYLQPLRRN